MEFNATFIVSAISFLVFVYLMNKIFYAPLEKIMTERENLIAETLNEAKNSRETAKGLMDERQEKLSITANVSKDIIAQSLTKATNKSKELTQIAKKASINEINSRKNAINSEHNKVDSQLDATIDELAQVILSKVL